MHVKLQSHTPDPEVFMAYVARVSNPANQSNPDHGRLLGYCICHGHWSVFEHAAMTLEVATTLDIATQILRHRSFCFQQLSRRYAGEEQAPVAWAMPQLRSPHPKDRQASLNTLPADVVRHWQAKIQTQLDAAHDLYRQLLAAGVAKECARAVLPQATTTTLYMTGNCRSWIHYIALRSQPGTQVEHRAVALKAQAIFRTVFPTCGAVLDGLDWAT